MHIKVIRSLINMDLKKKNVKYIEVYILEN